MDMLRDRTALTPEESIRASVPFAYASTTPQDRIDEDVQRRIEIPNTAEGYTNQLMGGLGYPGTKSRLHEVRVPTLVMTGDADQMVPPANTDILADAISDARKAIVPGAGHVVFTDAPEAVTSAILGFLDEVQADARR
jgi:pimeloyl-ACP methyl ester carboxylesterase